MTESSRELSYYRILFASCIAACSMYVCEQLILLLYAYIRRVNYDKRTFWLWWGRFSSESSSRLSAERKQLGFLLAAALIGWIVVVPYVVGRFLLNQATKKKDETSVADEKKTKNGTQKSPAPDEVDDSTSLLMTLVSTVSGIMCLVSVCYVVWMSSNNSFTSRAVFEAPLLTPTECDEILNYAYEAAARNVEGADKDTQTRR